MPEILALVFTEKYLAAGIVQNRDDVQWLRVENHKFAPLFFDVKEDGQVLLIDEVTFDRADTTSLVGHFFDAITADKTFARAGSWQPIENLLQGLLAALKAKYWATLGRAEGGRIPLALVLPDDVSEKSRDHVRDLLGREGFDLVREESAAAALLAQDGVSSVMLEALGGSSLQVIVKHGTVLEREKLFDFDNLKAKIALSKLVVDKALRNSFSSLLRDNDAARNEYRNHLQHADRWIESLQKEGVLNTYVNFSDGESGQALVRVDEFNNLLFDAGAVYASTREKVEQVIKGGAVSRAWVVGSKLANDALLSLLAQQFGRDRLVVLTDEDAAVRQVMIGLLERAAADFSLRPRPRVEPPVEPKPEVRKVEPQVEPPVEPPVIRVPEPTFLSEPEPVYVAPEPVYTPEPTPEPVYVAPEPVYTPPEPVYVAPEPVYTPEPEPVYVAPEPVYVAPEPKPEPIVQNNPPQEQDFAKVNVLMGVEPTTLLQEVVTAEYPKAIRKILKEEYSNDKSAKEAYVAELKRVAYISHPGLAKIYKVDTEARLPYFLGEYAEGKKLKALAPLATTDDVKKTILGLARAVEYLHGRDFWYKTLKADNVIVGKERTLLVASGLEYVTGGDAKSGLPNKVRINVKDLGTILLEMLTGKTTVQALNDIKDKRWSEVIKRTSAGSSAETYKNVGEMVADIEKRFAPGPAKPAPVPFPWAKVLLVAAVALAVVAIGLLGYVYRDRLFAKSDPEPADTTQVDKLVPTGDLDLGRLPGRYHGTYNNAEGQALEVWLDISSVNTNANPVTFEYNLRIETTAKVIQQRLFKQQGTVDPASKTVSINTESLRTFELGAKGKGFSFQSKEFSDLTLE
jgi:hypothetical protein